MWLCCILPAYILSVISAAKSLRGIVLQVFWGYLYRIQRNSSLMFGFLPCISIPTRYILPAPQTTAMNVA